MFALNQGVTLVKEYVNKLEYLEVQSASPDATLVTALCNSLNSYLKSAIFTYEAMIAA